MFSLPSSSPLLGIGSENVSLKKHSRFSNTVAFILICWKCLIQANFPRVDLLGTALKFRKKKKHSSLLVYVLRKAWNQAFSRRSRAVTAKKCTKKRDARAELLFCLTNPLLFLPFSLPSPSSLLKLPTYPSHKTNDESGSKTVSKKRFSMGCNFDGWRFKFSPVWRLTPGYFTVEI